MTKISIGVIALAGIIAFVGAFFLLSDYLRGLDVKACAARGLKTHESPGRSIRLVCIDEQRRLVFP